MGFEVSYSVYEKLRCCLCQAKQPALDTYLSIHYMLNDATGSFTGCEVLKRW